MKRVKNFNSIHIIGGGFAMSTISDATFTISKQRNMNKAAIRKALKDQGIQARYSGKDKTFYVNEFPSIDIVESIFADSQFMIGDHPPRTRDERKLEYMEFVKAQKQRKTLVEPPRKKRRFFDRAIDFFTKQQRQRRAKAKRAKLARRKNRK